MYISRVKLNVGSTAVCREIASPQRIHAMIEGCFPDVEGDKERKLWRIDSLNGATYLLVVSPSEPDFTKLLPQLCAEGTVPEIKDYSPLLAGIKNGQQYRFRLLCNPINRKKLGGYATESERPKRTKVHAQVTTEYQRQWLLDKALGKGFKLVESAEQAYVYTNTGSEMNTSTYEFDVIESGLRKFSRKDTATGTQMTVQFGYAVYEGVLEVIDAESFISALKNGIGREKAYGCGLLTIV